MKRSPLPMSSMLWPDPVASKERALNPNHSPNGAWAPDGFDQANGGAAELPDDYDIDRMVYPHAEGPDEKAEREYHHKNHMQEAEYRAEANLRNRDFDITIGAKTGKSGPPSPFGDDEK